MRNIRQVLSLAFVLVVGIAALGPMPATLREVDEMGMDLLKEGLAPVYFVYSMGIISLLAGVVFLKFVRGNYPHLQPRWALVFLITFLSLLIGCAQWV